jgi:hypothetical protein
VLRIAVTLALLQAGGFLLLETVERLLTGTGLTEMITHHLMAVGLAVQILVGLFSATLLRWLLRAGALLATVLARPSGKAATPVSRHVEVTTRSAALLSGAWGVRGPPLLPVS